MSRTIKKLVGLVKEELRSFKLRSQKPKAALPVMLGLLPLLVSSAAAAITTTLDNKPIKTELNTQSFSSQKNQWLKEVLIADQTQDTNRDFLKSKLMKCDFGYKWEIFNDGNCRIRAF